MQKQNEAIREETQDQAQQRALLDLVLLHVAADANQAPEAYLNETIVPEGGE